MLHLATAAHSALPARHRAATEPPWARDAGIADIRFPFRDALDEASAPESTISIKEYGVGNYRIGATLIPDKRFVTMKIVHQGDHAQQSRRDVGMAPCRT